MRRRNRTASTSAMFSLSTRIWPLVGAIRRLIILSVVVFPQPLGPTSTQISPLGTVKERSSTAGGVFAAGRAAYDLLTCRSSTVAPRRSDDGSSRLGISLIPMITHLDSPDSSSGGVA